ncbi:MAG: phosphopyruvate hydratase [Simkaniaceae bacterium]
MVRIQSIKGLEILDSRGNPTILATVATNNGYRGAAAVPSGASTGEHEAVELRDKDEKRFLGKGVLKAIQHINQDLAKLLIDQPIYQQSKLDEMMIEADGTDNKSKFGANAILGISLAISRAASASLHMPLFRYIGGCNSRLMPCPMMNIINGGAHADNQLDFQEFMIRPIGAPSFAEALRCGAEIFHYLKKILKEQGHVVSVGDEGGFAPRLSSNEEALEYIVQAISGAGYKPAKEVTIALDCAASEFYDKADKIYVEKKKKQQGKDFAKRTSEEQISYLETLVSKYPIDSIEDALDENDWGGWKKLTAKLGSKIQLVGDDLFVTNTKFLQKGIEEQAANSILIKPNQIGTLTETLNAIELAKTHNFTTIISHRSGETEDPIIADIAVATNAGQIKTGSLSRSDRISKYNRLLEIESDLGKQAIYKASLSFRKVIK